MAKENHDLATTIINKKRRITRRLYETSYYVLGRCRTGNWRFERWGDLKRRMRPVIKQLTYGYSPLYCIIDLEHNVYVNLIHINWNIFKIYITTYFTVIIIAIIILLTAYALLTRMYLLFINQLINNRMSLTPSSVKMILKWIPNTYLPMLRCYSSKMYAIIVVISVKNNCLHVRNKLHTYIVSFKK